jgi:hypothetical protein
MGGLRDGWIGRRKEWVDRWVEEWVDGGMGGWRDGRIGRRREKVRGMGG